MRNPIFINFNIPIFLHRLAAVLHVVRMYTGTSDTIRPPTKSIEVFYRRLSDGDAIRKRSTFYVPIAFIILKSIYGSNTNHACDTRWNTAFQCTHLHLFSKIRECISIIIIIVLRSNSPNAILVKWFYHHENEIAGKIAHIVAGVFLCFLLWFFLWETTLRFSE